MKFDGFLKVYLESNDEEEEDNNEEGESILPPLTKGQVLDFIEMTALERFSRPTSRFTEASLVKKLEELGKNDPECSYLVITISDGQENHSTHFNSNTLRKKIDACKATKKWTFSFMGCNDSDIKEFNETSGTRTSFQWSNAKSGDTEKSMRYASAKLGDYLENRSKGLDTSDEDYWLPTGACGPMGPTGATGCIGSYGDGGVSLNCAAVDIQLKNYVDKEVLSTTDSTFSKGNVAKWN